MDNKAIITIVKDWIHDLGIDTSDIQLEIRGLINTFKFDYRSSKVNVAIREQVINNKRFFISINNIHIAAIEENGILTDMFTGYIEPFSIVEIYNLLNRLKYPIPKEFKAFCKAIEEFFTRKKTRYDRQLIVAANHISMYTMHSGDYHAGILIKEEDNSITMKCNDTKIIEYTYCDNIVKTVDVAPPTPLSFADIHEIKDAIIYELIPHDKPDTDEDKHITDIKVKVYNWLTGFINKHGGCIEVFDDKSWTYHSNFPKKSVTVGIYSAYVKYLWIGNPANKVIVFDVNDNWKAELCGIHHECFPIIQQDLIKLQFSLNEFYSANKPDSTDEELLESISKAYRTVTDVLTDDFKQKVDDGSMKNTVINNASDFLEAAEGFKPGVCYFDSMIYASEIIKIRKEENKMNIPSIKHVLFNEVKKVTTVLFTDGTRVTSKATSEDEFDPEVGFAMCIMKKIYGNRSKFLKEIEKYHNAGAHRNRKLAEKAERKAKREADAKKEI